MKTFSRIAASAAALALILECGCVHKQIVTSQHEQTEITLSWWGNDSRNEYTLEAVELFKQKTYDAALFDIQMPVMDGLAATQEIRKLEFKDGRKRLPIIAVTARAMFGDKERILEAKMDDYIAKPYNLADVVEKLNKYVSESDSGAPAEKAAPVPEEIEFGETMPLDPSMLNE